MRTFLDINGNKTLAVERQDILSFPTRGFNIQTNGNLPRTHRDGIGPWTYPEVREYVLKFGSERQRDLLPDFFPQHLEITTCPV